jgi:hypothetical protein
MSVDRDSGLMLDDSIDNDSSCVSRSTSNNEESLDSYNSERCVVENAMKTAVPVSGSNGVSNQKTSNVNSTFVVGTGSNKYVEETNCAPSMNQSRPIFNISFRDRDIARLVHIIYFKVDGAFYYKLWQ